MVKRFQQLEPQSPRASPGLLTRRYSVPETVMRKYRLTQQADDTDEWSEPTRPQRSTARRDLARRSALLRRVCGRSDVTSGPHSAPRSLGASACDLCVPPPPPPAAAAPAPLTDCPCCTPPTVTSPPTPCPCWSPPAPLTADTPPYELLEIVVSETLESAMSTSTTEAQETAPASTAPIQFDIDRYVSDILVESLNSLTDQLESMSASIASDRKISIVEKEIKVKLQNAGVNTIVHLSPTSNNQIIFGNEELCVRERRDSTNAIPASTPPTAPAIDLLPPMEETSEESRPEERTNYAVMQQIQRLFHTEPSLLAQEAPPSKSLPLPPPRSLLVAPRSRPNSPSSPADSLDEQSPRIDVLQLLPDKPRAFFVRLDDGDIPNTTEDALRLPERLRRRLSGRSGARAASRRRDVRRDARAALDSLLDELIAKLVQDEYKCMRIGRRPSPAERAPLTERRIAKRSAEPVELRSSKMTRAGVTLMSTGTTSGIRLRGRMGLRQTQSRATPRRLYHKSEIHEGSKCIEILEIVEYSDASRSSPETSNSDESRAAAARRSKIPVRVELSPARQARRRAASEPDVRAAGTSSAAGPSSMAAAGLSSAMVGTTWVRSGSLRRARVCDVIQEEQLPPSPPRHRHVGTLTSPRRRSAGTSPPPSLLPPGIARTRLHVH